MCAKPNEIKCSPVSDWSTDAIHWPVWRILINNQQNAQATHFICNIVKVISFGERGIVWQMLQINTFDTKSSIVENFTFKQSHLACRVVLVIHLLFPLNYKYNICTCMALVCAAAVRESRKSNLLTLSLQEKLLWSVLFMGLRRSDWPVSKSLMEVSNTFYTRYW